jgi:hypothetical protein
MSGRAKLITAGGILWCVAGITPAFADPVVIRTGSMVADHFDPQGSFPINLNVTGTGGFTLAIGGHFLPGALAAADACGGGAWPTCSAEGPISIAADVSGSNALGRATLSGVSYSDVGGSNPGDPQVSLSFVGPDVIPVPFRDESGVIQGFTAEGPFSLFGSFAFTEAAAVRRTEQLVGSGSVRLSFFTGLPGTGSIDLVNANYQFVDPIPEPTSILLLGTGLGLVVTRLRRRKV